MEEMLVEELGIHDYEDYMEKAFEVDKHGRETETDHYSGKCFLFKKNKLYNICVYNIIIRVSFLTLPVVAPPK